MLSSSSRSVVAPGFGRGLLLCHPRLAAAVHSSGRSAAKGSLLPPVQVLEGQGVPDEAADGVGDPVDVTVSSLDNSAKKRRR